MKGKIYLFLLCGVVWMSCERDNLNYYDQYELSYQQWLNFKAENSNTYRYQITNSSWTGMSSQTTITVVEGKITQRHFKVSYLDNTNIPPEDVEWTENESQIGTHDYTPLLTLDEVYEKAKKEWLVKRKDAATYFEANNNGMISKCGYVDNNCVDDCFFGINIAFIEAIK